VNDSLPDFDLSRLVGVLSAIHHAYCHEATVLTDNLAKGYNVFYAGMPGTQTSITIIIFSCSGSMLSSDHGLNLY
jgi:hypothetical protein